MLRFRRRRAEGQIVIIVALSLIAVVGIGAVAIDIFQLYWNHNRLQSGCDAAALSGAIYLGNITSVGAAPSCAYGTKAANAACTSALANGVILGEIAAISVDNVNGTVTVSASRTVGAILATVLGISHAAVTVTSTATLRALSSASNVLPIGLNILTPYTYGQAIVMHVKSLNSCGSGCWQGLALPSSTGANGGNGFRDNLALGCACTLSVGDTISIEPGATTGPTKQGIKSLISSPTIDPSGTWDQHAPTDPRAAVVPLIDWTNSTIKGFAEIWITGSDGSNVNGVFIRQIATGKPGKPGVNYGAVHAVLTR